jgi:hypothetical protein
MTPDGQIANPLDKAANREPFLTVHRVSAVRTLLPFAAGASLTASKSGSQSIRVESGLFSLRANHQPTKLKADIGKEAKFLIFCGAELWRGL